MYLLDTDILSNLLKRTPSTALLRRMVGTDPELQFTSSITLGELLYGAYRLGPGREQLLRRIEQTLLPNVPVLPFDRAAAQSYGAARAALESTGVSIGEADLRIAAIALAKGLTVVTGNARHFRRVPGLRVENWLETPAV